NASSHSGQGAFPSSSQFPGNQFPSSAIPTSSSGINSVDTLAPACPVVAQLKLAPRSLLYTCSMNFNVSRKPSLSTIHLSSSSSYNSLPVPYKRGRNVCIVVPSPIAFPEFIQKGTSTSSLIASAALDRKSTRLNSSHVSISYAVFCLQKKNK